MSKLLFILCFASVLLTSCSGDENNDLSVVGTWELTAWEVADGFDINGDGTVSTNILNEIECVNNETLIFESNGVVSSNNTFNPDIEVALLSGTTAEYTFDVTCDQQGVIGFSTTYSQNADTVLFNNRTSTVSGSQLFRVIKEAIEIYNVDHTAVVATKDLTLIYTKQ